MYKTHKQKNILTVLMQEIRGLRYIRIFAIADRSRIDKKARMYDS